MLDKVVVNHKRFYIHLSKITKYSEKVLNKNINEVFTLQSLDNEILNKVDFWVNNILIPLKAIYQHFLYKRNTKIIEEMKKEINNCYNQKLEEKLYEIHNVLTLIFPLIYYKRF